MPFDLGDTVPLTIAITDAADAPSNASSVVLTVTLPDGTSATPSPTNPTVGTYQVDYLSTVPGRHVVRWVSTTPNSAYTDVFDVRESAVPHVVSLKDMKTHLDIKGTSRDEELRGVIEAVTGMIEEHLGMAVVRSTRIEEHTIRGSGLVLNWPPVASLVSLALVDGTYTWDVNTLHVSPAGVVTSPLGVAPYGHVSVVYTAGPTVIPAKYREAAEYTVQHLWKSKRPERGAGNRNSGLDSSMGYQQAGYALPNYAIECLGAGLPGIA